MFAERPNLQWRLLVAHQIPSWEGHSPPHGWGCGCQEFPAVPSRELPSWMKTICTGNVWNHCGEWGQAAHSPRGTALVLFPLLGSCGTRLRPAFSQTPVFVQLLLSSPASLSLTGIPVSKSVDSNPHLRLCLRGPWFQTHHLPEPRPRTPRRG